jgi:hypothetical protein
MNAAVIMISQGAMALGGVIWGSAGAIAGTSYTLLGAAVRHSFARTVQRTSDQGKYILRAPKTKGLYLLTRKKQLTMY